jgi:hypothetical protein
MNMNRRMSNGNGRNAQVIGIAISLMSFFYKDLRMFMFGKVDSKLLHLGQVFLTGHSYR